jgi:hypothetical protein
MDERPPPEEEASLISMMAVRVYSLGREERGCFRRQDQGNNREGGNAGSGDKGDDKDHDPAVPEYR